ncbi:type II toxin-antitoxin system HicB family antitoxin [Dolichospermum sp. ST_con]|nr:type II toxin-antitoxin system HicB family antitoxin [Dolichospermum sp. ST_con]MDD1421971.1 type II toxin-antitoxin system HicB family antitoxin [Dolichospermum sp. ST_sed1]MDD1427648.1 type II toxin-antitoxin system HicB family antitoxin [Dolichospermum sp. ST_sed9]MDD1429946.1 type II toxin-antitoxin system HicB family antitoxin [Dolichospermum sp. ST_sed6]MDD1443526.1 type II toxin-antitoxin system HicB family antitoxin [Dolichospermum sp. ST_sed3]MDD1445947.1 type II toxin-antitoxin sy
MKAELTAIIETATEGGYWAICPEISGANGQGETIEEAKESLKSAIQMILEDRLADIRRGLTEEVIEETISIP